MYIHYTFNNLKRNDHIKLISLCFHNINQQLKSLFELFYKQLNSKNSKLI